MGADLGWLLGKCDAEPLPLKGGGLARRFSEALKARV